MPLPESLEYASRILLDSTTKRGRPDQGVLRRCISTSYYAVFHKLIERSIEQSVRQSDRPVLRQIMSRAFEHSAMKGLSRSLAGGTAPDLLKPLFASVPSDLKLVAQEFAELQEMRHAADYDLTRQFTKADAQRGIEAVRRVFSVLDDDHSPDVRHFLLLMPLWPQLRDRK
jgi:uncharacterized protein (UPF0332 family)